MVLIAALSLVAVVAGCLGRSGPAPVPLRLGWVLSPASNTVTIQVTSPAGTAGEQVLARSRVAVSEDGGGPAGHWSAAGATVRVPVPAGARTTLVVQLTGPQQLTRTVTVSAPPAPRILSSGTSSGRWLVYTSSPLRAGPAQVLCGTDTVTMVASSQLAVTEGATACAASLRLTAQDGEEAAIPVTIPARSQAPSPAKSAAQLYCFAHSAGRAIYITIDDGWTPSQQVLTLMHQNYLPITAFLVADAAKENLGYWKEFVAAGGIIGDHTVSHPYLTKVALSQATTQWGQDRTDLGRWLGQTPAIGRPPYGAFDHDGGGGGRPGRADRAGRLERHHVGRPHPNLEPQAAEPGRDRHPALGSRPGPAARRPAEGDPCAAPEPDAADGGQLLGNRPAAARP